MQHFDPDCVTWNRRFPTESNGHPVNFDVKRQNLPETVPRGWEVTPKSVTHVNVQIRGQQALNPVSCTPRETILGACR